MWLAWSTWQALQQDKLIGDEDDIADADAKSRTLMQAILMNMLNPNPYIFWGSVTGPILVAGLKESVWHGVAFLAGFYVVFWLVNVALVVLFNRLRRLDDRLTRGALQLSILVLGSLGLLLLYQGISG